VQETTKIEYQTNETTVEGVVTHLPGKLSEVIDFDRMRLDDLPRSKRITLWFRHGAKEILRVSIVRRSGRWIVKLGGIEPQQVRQCVVVCRDHFDQWFGINSNDLKIYRRDRQPAPGEEQQK
jgi:hypothetical protein